MMPCQSSPYSSMACAGILILTSPDILGPCPSNSRFRSQRLPLVSSSKVPTQPISYPLSPPPPEPPSTPPNPPPKLPMTTAYAQHSSFFVSASSSSSSYPTPPSDSYYCSPPMQSYSQQQQQQQQPRQVSQPNGFPKLPPLSSIVSTPSPRMCAVHPTGVRPKSNFSLTPPHPIIPTSSPVAHRQLPPRQRTRSSGPTAAMQHQLQQHQYQHLYPTPHPHPSQSSSSSSSQSSLAAFQQLQPHAQPYPPHSWPSSEGAAVTVPTTPTSLAAAQQSRPPPSTVVTTPETTRKRTADFVAHNTCAMVCYLWFGHPKPPHQSPSPSPSPNPYSPSVELPTTDPALARLQFVPSKSFVEFMHTLLTTTQVSQSVIVLSLHYIYRLKCANPMIKVMEGSELRLATAALMLANKFLDE